jgi:hypothetical protein
MLIECLRVSSPSSSSRSRVSRTSAPRLVEAACPGDQRRPSTQLERVERDAEVACVDLGQPPLGGGLIRGPVQQRPGGEHQRLEEQSSVSGTAGVIRGRERLVDGGAEDAGELAHAHAGEVGLGK